MQKCNTVLGTALGLPPGLAQPPKIYLQNIFIKIKRCRPLEGAVRLGNPGGGGLAILCPVSAAAFDFGAAFGISGIAAKGDVGLALHAVAATAQADKVFLNHCAAVGFRHKVAALVGIPGAASGAAGERGGDVALDGGGDGGFLGHGVGSFAFHRYTLRHPEP